MHINIRLTEEIVNDCLALHYRFHPAGKRQKQKLLWIPVILVAISAYLIYTEVQKPEPGQNFYLALLYISFAIGYYFFMRKRMLNGGKMLLKALGNNANFTIDATEEQLTTTTENAVLTTTWNDFTAALISPRNVLLYQGNSTFTMFNETFFSPADFHTFKSWVREKVSPVIEADA